MGYYDKFEYVLYWSDDFVSFLEAKSVYGIFSFNGIIAFF